MTHSAPSSTSQGYTTGPSHCVSKTECCLNYSGEAFPLMRPVAVNRAAACPTPQRNSDLASSPWPSTFALKICHRKKTKENGFNYRRSKYHVRPECGHSQGTDPECWNSGLSFWQRAVHREGWRGVGLKFKLTVPSPGRAPPLWVQTGSCSRDR